MNGAILGLLAVNFGAASTAAARPATTLLGVQLLVVVLVRQDIVAVAEPLGWVVSVPALVFVAVVAVGEVLTRHDPDIAALARQLHIDKITGGLGTTAAVLLLSALGAPEARQITGGGMLEATATAAATDHPTSVQAGVVAVALGVNLGMVWLRSQLLEFIGDFSLDKLYARLETGGVVTVLVVLALFPVVAFGFFVLFAVALTALGLAARTARRVVDNHRRVDCQGCDYQVRVEASICPQCGTEREPTAEPASGFRAAVAALGNRSSQTASGS